MSDKQWNLSYDRHFLLFLQKYNINICVCSYKSGQIFSIGYTFNKDINSDVISFWVTDSLRPMSVTYHAESDNLIIGTKNHLVQYHNEGLSPSNLPNLTDFTTTFIERRSNVINDIDIHDVVVCSNGDVYYVSALFCCVCKRTDNASLQVFWTPPWISKVASEDRCHLNGLCLVDDVPRYVTSISQTDSHNGWRKHRENGGVVYDIVENKVVCENLSMPHSPTWHNGKLWLLESGRGSFGFIDFDDDNKFKEVVFVPGYIRGLQFVNEKYAIIGSSHDRHEGMFTGLPLADRLKEQQIDSECGIFVINIELGSIAHHFTFTKTEDEENMHIINEIYDIECLANCKRTIIKQFAPMDTIDYHIKEL